MASDEVVLPFNLTFQTNDSNRISFEATVPDAYSADHGTNYLQMNYHSSLEEEIYGMGLEYTIWNFKGSKIPLIVEEGGIGRGTQPISWYENRFKKGQGGYSTTSYGATPNYITNVNRGMIFNTTHIGIADFKKDDTSSFLFWHSTSIRGVILSGKDPLQLAQLSAQTVGLMPELPSWVHEGSILGITGGQKYVDEKYAILKDAGVKLVGVWMQDWVGEHRFPEGDRLLWNWKLNRDWYNDWDRMVADWAKDGVRPLIYFNPYIANLTNIEGPASNQFKEGVDNDYFVKNEDGEVYIIGSISIDFAMVDFTNPAACKWFGDILVTNGVEEAKAIGWMHDFGEYLPFDAVLFNGADPKEYHNKYPEAWAKVAHDHLADYPDVVPFMRSASVNSPKYTRLYWMGDQLVSFGKHDGMWSAMIGLMNSGLSGMTMGHSDIGGYTSCNILDIGLISYIRQEKLLVRWIEMSTFSDAIMRSHPGNLPNMNYQIWDDSHTVQLFKNFTEIHVALGDYKAMLVEEATTKGTPFTRPCLLHFPDSPGARAEHSEFMLGPNILMAPMMNKFFSHRHVYLPGPANWTYLWTGYEHKVGAEGLHIKWFNSPEGRPAVFLRSTEEYPFDIHAFIVKVYEIFGLTTIEYIN